MVGRFPPNHRDSKFQRTPCSFGPLTKMLDAGLAYHVRCPKFILITQLHTEIRMISTLYKVGDRVPVGNKGVFTTDVAKYIRLIFTRSST